MSADLEDLKRKATLSANLAKEARAQAQVDADKYVQAREPLKIGDEVEVATRRSSRRFLIERVCVKYFYDLENGGEPSAVTIGRRILKGGGLGDAQELWASECKLVGRYVPPEPKS